MSRTETVATAAQNWLTQFETALARPDDVPLKTLFHADSYWRDLLALTWRIQTVNGADAILTGLKAHIGSARPAAFMIDPRRAAPRHVTRAGAEAIEAIFTFETAEGRGNGVLRLTPDAGDGDTLKAWTLLTALDEIKGYEEQF
jgi:putative flavoprotein involved in K+ transport